MAWSKRYLDINSDCTVAEDCHVLDAIGLDFMDAARVLDVGCFDGYNTVSRFAPYKSVSAVVGIDISEEALGSARKNCKDPRFSFVHCDACKEEDRNFLDELKKSGNAGQFDIVYFANSLQHMEDKVKALRFAWGVLKPGGFVIARTIDDDLKFSFPDPEGRMNQVLAFYEENICHLTPWTRWTDRRYGKKGLADLASAGFIDAQMHVSVSSTAGKSLDDRLRFFDRCTYFRYGSERFHDAETLLKMGNLLESWKALLQDELYLFGSATVMVWARKPGREDGSSASACALPLPRKISEKKTDPQVEAFFKIDRMTEGDLSSVMRMESTLFPEAWTVSAYVAELRHNPASLFVTAKNEEGVLLGYSGLWVCGTEAWIVKVAVGEEYRRRGIAAEMIDSLCICARNLGCCEMLLEFRESNVGARGFYEAIGFVEQGNLKDYYQNPDECAVVMRKAL